MTCEKDFVEGIQIYEAIVETKMFETTQNQISSLEEIGDTLMTYSRWKRNEKNRIIYYIPLRNIRYKYL